MSHYDKRMFAISSIFARKENTLNVLKLKCFFLLKLSTHFLKVIYSNFVSELPEALFASSSSGVILSKQGQ